MHSSVAKSLPTTLTVLDYSSVFLNESLNQTPVKSGLFGAVNYAAFQRMLTPRCAYMDQFLPP